MCYRHKKMRILYVDQHYKYSGGAEQYYLDMMEMVEKAGQQVLGVKEFATSRRL